MNEEIVMNITPMESRIAVIENGLLQEIHIERVLSKGLVGNIYKGKIIRVMPGMQAAFVDIGLERSAFIHVNEIINKHVDQNNTPGLSISNFLYEGQSLLVQVIKDPLGSKGARLSSYLSIPARYLVLVPDMKQIGISLKIDDKSERERLKNLVEREMEAYHVNNSFNFIIRTVAKGVGEREIQADMKFLCGLWKDISDLASISEVPNKVYEDLPLYLRIIRDLGDRCVEKILIDSHEKHKKVLKFVEKLVPEKAECVKHYNQDLPIFDLYNIEDEIEKALLKKVKLKSGGYLVIDQTESMTTIDVNTGAFVGYKNLEETIFKTNLEAAFLIARHLRLRNLGGIIIIDFIDMSSEDHQRQLERFFEKSTQNDRVTITLTGISDLGLVEMTRQRTRESLRNILCEVCSSCKGNGNLKTAQTVCYEVFREILRMSKAYDSKSYTVLASEKVIDRLIDEESDYIAHLSDFIKKPIKFQVETVYNQEQFDIILE